MKFINNKISYKLISIFFKTTFFNKITKISLLLIYKYSLIILKNYTTKKLLDPLKLSDV